MLSAASTVSDSIHPGYDKAQVRRSSGVLLGWVRRSRDCVAGTDERCGWVQVLRQRSRRLQWALSFVDSRNTQRLNAR